MKESVEKRVELIKGAEGSEDLKKCLCPFFEKGSYPSCFSCRKSDDDLEECRDYYLDRIRLIPLDLWDDSFDRLIVHERDPLSLEEVVGVGSTCDRCYMFDKCPLYREGYVCGIKWDSNKPKTPTEFMDFLINTQFERVKRASVFEKIDGGVPDAGLSGEMDRLHGLVASKNEMGRDRFSVNIEASTSSRSEGGILAKLFGGGSPTLPEKKIIEIPESTESRKDIGELTEFEEIKEPEKVPRQRKTKN